MPVDHNANKASTVSIRPLLPLTLLSLRVRMVSAVNNSENLNRVLKILPVPQPHTTTAPHSPCPRHTRTHPHSPVS